jgi:hypothetical protein
MQLPVPLHSAVLVRRYKRFLVDCTLADATPVTAHLADPGRLPGLVDEAARLWLSASDDPGRKLAHRVELSESGGTLVGANTANANRLVAEALAARRLPSLAAWTVASGGTRLAGRFRHPGLPPLRLPTPGRSCRHHRGRYRPGLRGGLRPGPGSRRTGSRLPLRTQPLRDKHHR